MHPPTPVPPSALSHLHHLHLLPTFPPHLLSVDVAQTDAHLSCNTIPTSGTLYPLSSPFVAPFPFHLLYAPSLFSLPPFHIIPSPFFAFTYIPYVLEGGN
ncbi:hypothetical protein E2C01_097570 [Portunus trituberculatus]|uniref:Uncharacterized protein n=1 Tax=Portunus trituberculatus TaxID=210409 RepID=A0A5B7K564_PORTR|nr:hypothetical protein [Portunus trituberculatus]